MADRTLEEILADLRRRVALLERSSGRGGGGTSRSLSPFRLMNWAAKSGPVAWGSAYKSSWQRGEGNGGVLDAVTNPSAIVIGMTGVYEVHAHQRGTTGSDYIGIAINGNRATLEQRVGGVWTHDHAAGVNNFSNAYYMGPLSAGELLTVGGAAAGGLVFGGATTAGAVFVRRIS